MKTFHRFGLFLIALMAVNLTAFAGTQGQYPSFSGQKKIAIIMLSWSDTACPATHQNVVDRLWNDPKSLRNYYLDLSRGALDFTLPAGSSGGTAPANTPDIYGPYELSVAAGFHQDVTYANADDLYGGGLVQAVQSVARTLAADRDGYNYANYDYIMYVTPKSDSTGGVRGFAGLNTNYSHIFEVSNRTINHEIGHNLGMHHSNTGLDSNNYSSYDCIMANNRVPHLDAPHTYQMGWYPDDCWSMKSYGQFDIENLAQPNTDNLKFLRFNRGVHGATTYTNYNFWVEYRTSGVGQDNDLDGRWNKTVTVHMSSPSSRRPGDSFNYPFSNQVANFPVQGSYTGSESTCSIRFVRENTSSASATVQLIDPNGNQPPSVTEDQHYHNGTGINLFSVLATDPENNSLTYTIVEGPAEGTLSNSGSTFTYTITTPGTYSFKVRVNDGQYDSYDETCNVTVHPSSTPAIFYTSSTFSEHYTSDGTIANLIDLNLIFDNFTGADGRDLAANGDASVTNLPLGLTAKITKISNHRVRITLLGAALSHEDADDVNDLTVSFSNSAFGSGVAGGVVNSTRNDLLIDFTDSTGWSVVLIEGFEDPVVSGFLKKSMPSGSNWVGATNGYGSDNRGLINKDGGDFLSPDPNNHQGFAFRYTNSGITSAEGVIGSVVANAGYRVSFKVVMDGGLNNGTPYTCQLIAFSPGADRSDIDVIPAGSTLLDSVSGDAAVDGSFSTINLEFIVDPVTHSAEIGKDFGLRFIGGSTSAIIDDVIITSSGATTYSVTYSGNGSDGGTPPTDDTSYSNGAAVTILGNTSSLTKSGFSFVGWNTAADGSGMSYSAADTFSITQGVTLHAQWATTFANWGGGVTFSADSNGDGVANGMAWLLGAANENAINMLPLVSVDGGGSIVLNFTCLKVANRGGATLKVQASDDLGITDAWTDDEAVVPDTSGVVNGMSFVTSPHTNPVLINVQVTVPSGGSSKIFLRLMGEP